MWYRQRAGFWWGKGNECLGGGLVNRQRSGGHRYRKRAGFWRDIGNECLHGGLVNLQKPGDWRDS